jgi:hypothetical protein
VINDEDGVPREATAHQISEAAPSLQSSPTPIDDIDELLFRQVHPSLLDGDIPASSAFMPTESDKGQLSVDRESISTAQAAHELYVESGLESVGSFGITVGEFNTQNLLCFPDPILAAENRKANPAHARVDFSAFGRSRQRALAKRLKGFALGRGLLHKP